MPLGVTQIFINAIGFPLFMNNKEKSLWEILVPVQSNDGLEFSLQHHRAWDDKVRKISSGLTILKTAKGQWVTPDDKLFFDKMIPVRIYCDENEIDEIIKLTLSHYDQKAVMAYQVSSYVKLVYRDEIDK